MSGPLLQIEVSVFRSQPGDWAVCGQRSDTSSQAVQALVGECDTGCVGGFGDAGGADGFDLGVDLDIDVIDDITDVDHDVDDDLDLDVDINFDVEVAFCTCLLT